MKKIVFTMGDKATDSEECAPLEFTIPIKRTMLNRVRFWLFFKFFPFKFKEWLNN